MTLIPTLKQRLAQPSDLIDLGGVRELAGITVAGDTVTTGAMTTHATVANSRDVAGAIPALAALASNIGDPQVRTRGPIGHSGAHNQHAADTPAASHGHVPTHNNNSPTLKARDVAHGPVTKNPAEDRTK